MRRLFIGLLLIIATQTFAQDLRRADDGEWALFNQQPICIGGSGCPEKRLRLPLEDRPVVAVRFRAHDDIGNKREGVLRVKIDGNTIRDFIAIPRHAELFNLDVDELRGRYLVFEPAKDDEVEISEVAVLYAAPTGRIPRPRDPDRGGPWRGGEGGWRAYPRAAGCIGGDECGRNGNRITIALENAPVLGVRFYAHDAVGQRADGKLRVRIDDTQVGWTIDVLRAGKRHELDVDNVFGTRLVIETASDDEVDIKDVEVLYGRGGRRGGDRYDRREVTHEGGCIGGDECGGKRARIRVPIYGRNVDSIRFYARDDIGRKAGGELLIRIDDEIIEYALDIKREGKTITIDGRGLAGDYLIFEPAEDDEVEIKDIRVRFEPEEE